tara:strand:- start:418 stop:630 length:213 start_codon:yes stop_codon:yes gene_type:complete
VSDDAALTRVCAFACGDTGAARHGTSSVVTTLNEATGVKSKDQSKRVISIFRETKNISFVTDKCTPKNGN